MVNVVLLFKDFQDEETVRTVFRVRSQFALEKIEVHSRPLGGDGKDNKKIPEVNIYVITPEVKDLSNDAEKAVVSAMERSGFKTGEWKLAQS